MAKVVDTIVASAIIFLTTFVWSALIFKNAIGALVFSIAFAIVIAFSFCHFSKRGKKPYTYDRLESEFCIRGGEYVIDLINSIIKNNDFESCSNYILLANSIIIANFKFSPLGANDIANACKLALRHERNKIYLITKAVDRKAWQVAYFEEIRLEIVKTKQVFKFLSKHNALPNLNKTKSKFSARALIQTIFSRRNFKNYVFSGAVLICVSFLTPLKIYYIVFGTLLMLLALISLTPLGNGTISTPKIFDELEKQTEYEYVREKKNNELI